MKEILPAETGPIIPKFSDHARIMLLNPNPYNLGIANLGMQAIADYLIKREVNISFVYPETITQNLPLADTPDILAISLPFETTFITSVQAIKKLGFPLRSNNRRSEHPIVIGGGMVNPMPMSDFLDAIVMGEGRKAMWDIVQKVQQGKTVGLSRNEIVQSLSEIPGVYIPSLYRFHIDDSGYVSDFQSPQGDEIITPRPYLDLNLYPICSHWTSSIAVYGIKDYFSIMVALGCNKKCPFCLVGNTQGGEGCQLLLISHDLILALAQERRGRYGVSLIKLFFSSSYSDLKILLSKLLSSGFHPRVGSLSLEQIDDELVSLIKQSGQKEIVVAPETVENLRPNIEKAWIKDEYLFYTVTLCNKYDVHLTLYTMCGIPGETFDDVRRLGSLLLEVRGKLKDRLKLTVHFNQIYAKASTPLQFMEVLTPEQARERIYLLRSVMDSSEVSFVTGIDSSLSLVQPILARGDQRLGTVIENLSGIVRISEKDWRIGLENANLKLSSFFKEKETDRHLPWEHLMVQDPSHLRARYLSIKRRI